MEKYSLLKLRPALSHGLNLASSKNKNQSILRDSLYSVLDGVEDEVRGQRLRVEDGRMRREYEVIKYERYKAGLMGRVWLRRQDALKDANRLEGDLVRDEDALGLKWKIVQSGRVPLKDEK